MTEKDTPNSNGLGVQKLIDVFQKNPKLFYRKLNESETTRWLNDDICDEFARYFPRTTLDEIEMHDRVRGGNHPDGYYGGGRIKKAMTCHVELARKATYDDCMNCPYKKKLGPNNKQQERRIGCRLLTNYAADLFVIDREIALSNIDGENCGEIDLLFLNNGEMYFGEFKRQLNTELPLRAIFEIETYWRTANRTRLIEDYTIKIPKLKNVLRSSEIKKAILIYPYSCKDENTRSENWTIFDQFKRNKNGNVVKLLKELQIELLDCSKFEDGIIQPLEL